MHKTPHMTTAGARFESAIINPLVLELHRSEDARKACERRMAELGIEHDGLGFSFNGSCYDWLEDAMDDACESCDRRAGLRVPPRGPAR